MVKMILFDLDGTLLPMDQDHFVETYFGYLAARFAKFGYDPRQFIADIWAGVKAMVANDGTKSNEEAFWADYEKRRGSDNLKRDYEVFDDFYHNEFPKARTACGFTDYSARIIKALKKAGYRVALATNPIFPAIATQHRIHWAGLEPDDFEYYTTYENSSCSKPNPDYFRAVLEAVGCRAEECIMVGNDADEDLAAATAAGIPVFLLTDCLINTSGRDLTGCPQGGFPELAAYLGVTL